MNYAPIPGKGRRLKVGTCAYCDRKVFPAGSPEVRANPDCQATRDHIEPQVLRVGRHRDDNLVIACFGCNKVKASYPVEPFLFFLRAHKGTPKFNASEFKRFIYDLTLAGFHAARVVALDSRRAA